VLVADCVFFFDREFRAKIANTAPTMPATAITAIGVDVAGDVSTTATVTDVVGVGEVDGGEIGGADPCGRFGIEVEISNGAISG
jgi:hypothetical protein